MEKLERFKRGIAAMGADERAALQKALEAAVALHSALEREKLIDRITDIGAAKGRTLARQDSDRRTDFQRRSLVGARIPREDAQRCRRCAELEGKSLYRFVLEALEAACERVERAFDRAGQGGET